MKVEEKMKKNINYELSHMIRPAGSLEVYKQKQNILFISESVEHRMFKVTRAYAWPSARAYARPSVCVGRMGSLAVRDNGLDGRAAWWFVSPRPGYSFCTTRMGTRLGLVVVHDLVGTRPRFGRDAYELNFMGMIEPCG